MTDSVVVMNNCYLQRQTSYLGSVPFTLTVLGRADDEGEGVLEHEGNQVRCLSLSTAWTQRKEQSKTPALVLYTTRHERGCSAPTLLASRGRPCAKHVAHLLLCGTPNMGKSVYTLLSLITSTLLFLRERRERIPFNSTGSKTLLTNLRSFS